jgi:hypothetical protein
MEGPLLATHRFRRWRDRVGLATVVVDSKTAGGAGKRIFGASPKIKTGALPLTIYAEVVESFDIWKVRSRWEFSGS